MLKKILSIILIIILMQSFCLTTLANSIDDLKQQKKDAEEKHTDIEEKLSTELDAICNLDAEINECEKEIGKLEGKIEALNKSIKESENEIERLQKEYIEKE